MVIGALWHPRTTERGPRGEDKLIRPIRARGRSAAIRSNRSLYMRAGDRVPGRHVPLPETEERVLRGPHQSPKLAPAQAASDGAALSFRKDHSGQTAGVPVRSE